MSPPFVYLWVLDENPASAYRSTKENAAEMAENYLENGESYAAMSISEPSFSKSTIIVTKLRSSPQSNSCRVGDGHTLQACRRYMFKSMHETNGQLSISTETILHTSRASSTGSLSIRFSLVINLVGRLGT